MTFEQSTDEKLLELAIKTLNPRRLSPSAEAGGVGSALITASGKIFTGVCIDVACSIGFCAEHTAIGTMITSGESRIETIVAVNWDKKILPPCGRCREMISQIDPGNSTTRVLLKGGRVRILKELLPENWMDEIEKP
jgi:cytidine deaminase